MAFDIKRFLVDGDKKWQWKDYPCKYSKDIPKAKEDRNKLAAELSTELDVLQDRLYGEGKRKLLVILQGMDTSGKDGTIRHVFQNVDPLGVRVEAFKAPSEAELARDYLWRVHQVVPKNGEIAIFNRSHYEDVLVTRVKEWIDADTEARRIDHINGFETMLSDTGTEVVKIFLNISKEEQRERLQQRIDDPSKNWKFNLGDLEDRQLWDKFQSQYARVMRKTSSKAAPWYVVPADSKSTRNIIVLQILLHHLRDMNPQYPSVDTSEWPKQIK